MLPFRLPRAERSSATAHMEASNECAGALSKLKHIAIGAAVPRRARFPRAKRPLAADHSPAAARTREAPKCTGRMHTGGRDTPLHTCAVARLTLCFKCMQETVSHTHRKSAYMSRWNAPTHVRSGAHARIAVMLVKHAAAEELGPIRSSFFEPSVQNNNRTGMNGRHLHAVQRLSV
jgi:hypothetical protein